MLVSTLRVALREEGRWTPLPALGGVHAREMAGWRAQIISWMREVSGARNCARWAAVCLARSCRAPPPRSPLPDAPTRRTTRLRRLGRAPARQPA